MTDHKPCDPADPCSTAFDLASERNTLEGLWAETKDRLDAALAQVARLREALRRTATDIRAQAKASELYARDERRLAGVLPTATEISIGNFKEIADRAERAAPAETADTPAPPPADDGWIKWEGGECPVSPETLVDVRYRSRVTNVRRPAKAFRWSNMRHVADIVAYRIAEARDE